jgi:isochorismate pyruvate lyase
MQRLRTFSAATWESKAGFCRAIRAGNHIYVSGTAPVDERGGVFAPNDAYAQTRHCLEIIQKALQELGADFQDVVRTRFFVTDMKRWADFAQAHQECFGEYLPANTMVEIQALIDPAMLVEVEVDAVCQSQ